MIQIIIKFDQYVNIRFDIKNIDTSIFHNRHRQKSHRGNDDEIILENFDTFPINFAINAMIKLN